MGKTTSLRLAGSVWGNPDRVAGGGSVVLDWNTTAVYRERAMAVCNNVPLLLDDTKTARFPDEIATTVYTHSQGRGRGRGTVRGIDHQPAFQSVLISTGEQPVTSFGEHGGTRARVVPLWGSPFGAANDTTRAVVASVNRLVAENHGHAGPRFVQALAYDCWRWGRYRKQYRELVDSYTTQAGDNPAAGRMAAYLAAITAASKVVHRFLDMPYPWSDPVAPLWAELTAEAAEADRAAAAMRHAFSWAVGRSEHFFGMEAKGRKPPPTGWAGRWDRGGGAPNPTQTTKTGWAFVGFLRPVLEDVLRGGGYAFDATVKAWHDKGWLRVSGQPPAVQNPGRGGPGVRVRPDSNGGRAGGGHVTGVWEQ